MASKHDRYLFGYSLADKLDVKKFIKLRPLSTPPTAEAGIVYFDGTNFLGCTDGTNFSAWSVD